MCDDNKDERLKRVDDYMKDVAKKQERLRKKSFQRKTTVARLKEKIDELETFNNVLRANCNFAGQESMKQRHICREMKTNLETVQGRLTDLKEEATDQQQQKIEELQEKVEIQETEIVEQQEKITELSLLVNLEAGTDLQEEGDKPRESRHNTRDHSFIGNLATRNSSLPTLFKNDAVRDPVIELQKYGEICIARKHEMVIRKQKSAISELRSSLSRLEDLPQPGTTASHNFAIAQVSNLTSENSELKAQLNTLNSTSDVYSENTCLKEQIAAIKQELSFEKTTHRECQEILHKCEESHLNCYISISKEMDMQDVLGSQSVLNAKREERDAILQKRKKAFENILKEIKSIRIRLQEKEKLLESRDEGIRNMRLSEAIADKKTSDMKEMEIHLRKSRDEITYLKQSVIQFRGECNELRRLNNSIKEKKVRSVRDLKTTGTYSNKDKMVGRSWSHPE